MRNILTALLISVVFPHIAHAATVKPLNGAIKVTGEIAAKGQLTFSEQFSLGDSVHITLQGWCDRYSDTAIFLTVRNSRKNFVVSSRNPNCWQDVKFDAPQGDRYFITLTSGFQGVGGKRNPVEKFDLTIDRVFEPGSQESDEPD